MKTVGFPPFSLFTFTKYRALNLTLVLIVNSMTKVTISFGSTSTADCGVERLILVGLLKNVQNGRECRNEHFYFFFGNDKIEGGTRARWSCGVVCACVTIK